MDKRLFTIPPSIVGFIFSEECRKGRPSSRAVRLANQSMGLYRPSGHWWERDFDRNRAHVVLDWAVRCAFPMWLDRLPRWCVTRAAADELRQTSGMQWLMSVVRALAIVTEASGALTEGAILDQGTGDERQIIALVGEKAIALRGLLAREAALLTSQSEERRDSWFCERLIKLLASRRPLADRLDDTDVAATLPGLLAVLMVVQTGDSQRSVQDRCDWTKRARKRAA